MLKFTKEIKIVFISNVIFSISIIVILSFFIIFLKRKYEITLMKETYYILHILENKKLKELPGYITIHSANFLEENNCFFVPELGKYLCVNKDIYFRPLYIFSVFIFLVTSLFFLFQFLITYYLINNLIKNNKRINNILETIILGISHKFGNIISSQKVLMELLKEDCKSRYLDRLDIIFKLLEKDLKSVLNFIKAFEMKENLIQKINISSLIWAVLEEYKSIFPKKTVEFHKPSKVIYVRANYKELENLITSIIENAFLHSEYFIKIKLLNINGKAILCVMNDIRKNNEYNSHSGIGYVLMDSIVKRYNYKIKKYVYKSKFIVCIEF